MGLFVAREGKIAEACELLDRLNPAGWTAFGEYLTDSLHVCLFFFLFVGRKFVKGVFTFRKCK